MPPLVASLSGSVRAALDLADKGESAKTELSRSRRAVQLSASEIYLLYEVAYLRIFVAWEDFLDRAFVHYLCGRINSVAQEALLPGQDYARTIADAEARAYAGSPYALWHNPDKVILRARRFFDAGLIESVISSDIGALTSFGAVRHRIAHGHNDSKRKFDAATMVLAGKRYAAGRPGRFLRDSFATAAGSVRWLDKIGNNLLSLAGQIVP